MKTFEDRILYLEQRPKRFFNTSLLVIGIAILMFSTYLWVYHII